MFRRGERESARAVIPVVLFAATALILAYLYGGYLVLLRFLLVVRRWSAGGHRSEKREAAGAGRWVDEADLPGLTVFVPAFNERDRIRRRIDNLLEQEYPPDRLEIIVVSDGSTDGTAEIVRDVARSQARGEIRLIEFEENRGRAETQNLVAEEARHEILISTDADTLFAEGFLRRIAEPFLDGDVGVAGGRLIYRELDSDISASMQDYWGYETALREAEQELGVLTKVSGPCMAYRREIWQPIRDFEDADRVAVFFARERGLRAVHVGEAVCFDTPNSHWKQEIQVRRRMTRKGILSIFHRWGPRKWLGEPAFSFALFSHKVARWGTPLYTVACAGSGLVLAHRLLGPEWTAALVLLASAGVGLAFLAGLGPARWLVSRLKSFVLANIGFSWGLLDVLLGNREGRYLPSRKLASGGGDVPAGD